MALDKAIKSGKEHRKPYYGAGKTDLTCRPNGKCPYCFNGRMHRFRRQLKELSTDE